MGKFQLLQELLFTILYSCTHLYPFPLGSPHYTGFDTRRQTYYGKLAVDVFCGYHHYKNVWSTVEGEMLQCVQEPRNTTNPYAVAVMKGNMVVGHVPRIISSACSLFLRKQGTISCTITGSKHSSKHMQNSSLRKSLICKTHN